MLYCLLCFLCWGMADLFYKIGNNNEEDKYSYLKTGAIVGFVMGIHALIYMLVNNLSVNFMDMLKYLPVSLCYILSMVIGYKGLKYIELSISSPIQNTSGVITSILLILFFKESYDLLAYIGIGIVFLGILTISIKEYKENRNFELKVIKKKLSVLAVMFPLTYCIIDGLGTFLDGIYLDELELISEDSALLSYEFTFLIYGIISLIFLKLKNEKIAFIKTTKIKEKKLNSKKKKEKIKVIEKKEFFNNTDTPKLIAAILETAGQFFYVFAMTDDSVIGATVIGSYFILSLLLSSIFLKEKLHIVKYIGIAITTIGIAILLTQGL